MKIPTQLQEIINDADYKKLSTKLYMQEPLTDEEQEFLLVCALLFSKEYDKSKDDTCFELAYNIFLRYSILTKDYRPLYEFSYNHGFYPTARFINSKKLLGEVGIENAINDFLLEEFKNENYIETYEQHKTRDSVIKSEYRNVSFIAPTSSGKSSIIIQHLKRNGYIQKALILVPSKSLVAQSYSELRKGDLKCKIISHETMYNGEERFVGALTQERALRLLEKNKNLIIDCLYVDEAHNLLSNDPRNVLLTRVIRACKKRNQRLQVVYLSPFVEKSSNLLLHDNEEVSEQRINHNIKEADIFEYKSNGTVRIYDRFSGNFYVLKNSDYQWQNDPFGYMFSQEQKKNFCFLASPKKIEEFTEELFNRAPEVTMTESIKDLIETLEKCVHADFKMIKYLSRGIIYLHAKLPEQIKEYLEYQFKTNPDIHYLVANSVIMEGINLPIDALFIWNDYGLDSGSKLLNLIGRVNRLNNIFDVEKGDLSKLLPKVHFIESDYANHYNNNDTEKSIRRIYEQDGDSIKNPLLPSYEIDNPQARLSNEDIQNNRKITEEEAIYETNANDEIEILRYKLISTGMNQFVDISDEELQEIYASLQNVDTSMPIMDIVRNVFILGKRVTNEEFGRLRNEKAANYYKFFIEASHTNNLNSLIESEYRYHVNKSKDGNGIMYIGKPFGECSWDGRTNVNYNEKQYVNLTTKTAEEIINLLIVKIKIEQDFVGYQYDCAVNFLHEYGIIDDDRYNMEVFGTNDPKKIEMLSQGIPIGVLTFLENEDQLSHISTDEHGNLRGDDALREFRDRQNAFWQYEINKHIFFN